MGYGLYGLWVVFPVGCIPIRQEFKWQFSYLFAKIRNYDFCRNDILIMNIIVI